MAQYPQPTDPYGGVAGAGGDASVYPQMTHHIPPPTSAVTDPSQAHHLQSTDPALHANYQAMAMRSPQAQAQVPASKGSPTAAGDTSAGRDQDRLLPIANIARIMKRAIPASGKLSKEAKACVQECVSEFIGFITSEASERLGEDKRKTITGDDIIESMRALGFDAYISFLQTYLMRYRESTKGGRAAPVKRGRKKGGEDGGDEDGDEDEEASTAGAATASGSGAGGKAAGPKKKKSKAAAADAGSATAATSAIAGTATAALNTPLPAMVQPPPLPVAGGGFAGSAYPQPHMHQQQIMQAVYGQAQR